MYISNNSLMEKIKELVRLCEQIASDYGDDASWFKQPASDEMISIGKVNTTFLFLKHIKNG